MIALTATITRTLKHDIISIFEMDGCKYVSASPNRNNIYYEVHSRSDESMIGDMAQVVDNLREKRDKAERIIEYCRSVKVCADFIYLSVMIAISPQITSVSIYCLECFMLKPFHVSRNTS